MKQASNKLQ